MRVVKAGLCCGRHPFPGVEFYIYGSTVDPLDYDALYAQAVWFLKANKLGSGDALCLYITGLTAATLAVVRACHEAGVGLIAYHYDKKTGGFTIQYVFGQVNSGESDS